MSRWLNRFQPWGVLLLRLVLGAAMIVNGSRKVIPRGGFHGGNTFAALQQYANNIATLGIPHWLGYISAFAEFVGGMFLVLGLLTRFFALLIAMNMIVALVAVDLRQGYAGTQYSLALASIAVMLLLTGPGKAALDRTLGFS